MTSKRFDGVDCALVMGETVEMFEYFMDKSAEMRLPRWRFFDVVESAQLELLWTVKKSSDGRWRQVIRRRKHEDSLAPRCGGRGL